MHDPVTPAVGLGALTAIGGRAEPRPVAGPVAHDVRFVSETIAAACRPCGWRVTLETGHTATELSRLAAEHAGEPPGDAGTEPSGDAGTEPYCLTCGEWCGIVRGLEGWHHFRSDAVPGGIRTLHPTDHEPVIARIVPPGRALSPAALGIIAAALADAITYRHPAGYCRDCEAPPASRCEAHAEDAARSDVYRALAAALSIESEEGHRVQDT